MRKAILAGALSLLLLGQCALAEAYTGRTAAARSLSIAAEAGGIVREVQVVPGETVAAGDGLASLSTTKVFATQDGTVARIQAAEGDRVDGSVLEIAPLSRYTIHCSVEKAWDSPETQLVRSGEGLYVKCCENGSHRGMGVVTQIDGETYLLEATGGEFYVGEAVYLFRDEDFSREQRVGAGTVVPAATEVYEASGTLLRLHVAEGERVERGELLYEIINGEAVAVVAGEEAIVTAVAVQPGQRVEDGQTLMTLAPLSSLCVEVELEERDAARLRLGDAAEISYLSDPDETQIPGTVVEILQLPGEAGYTVRIAPEILPERIGQTVTVRIGS